MFLVCFQGLSIREKTYEGLKIRREMARSIEKLRELLGPSEEQSDVHNLKTLGKCCISLSQRCPSLFECFS